MEEKICYFLLAHGSNHPASNESASKFENILQAEGFPHPIRLCYLRTNEPVFSAELEEAGRKGFTKIVVMPLFIFAGSHVTEEIPQIINKFNFSFPNVQVVLLPPLAEIPSFYNWIKSLLLNNI